VTMRASPSTRSRRRTVAGLASAGLVLASCGDPTSVASSAGDGALAGEGTEAVAGLPIDELGGCYIAVPPGASADPMLLDQVLADVDEWLVLPPGTELTPERELESDFVGDHGFVVMAATLERASDDIVRFAVDDVVVSRIEEALAAGATVQVGVDEVDRPTSAVVATDGEQVAFLANCGYERHHDVLRAYADAHGLTPAAALAHVIEPDGYLLLADVLYGPEPLTWDELPAVRRQFDPELTPPEVLEQTVALSILFDVPPERADSTGLCLRTAIAWSACIDLAIEHPVVLPADAVPGSDLEVWLISEHPAWEALARVGVVPRDLLAEAVEGDLVIHAVADVPMHVDQLDGRTNVLTFSLLPLEEAEAISER